MVSEGCLIETNKTAYVTVQLLINISNLLITQYLFDKYITS
jgi:hypothetical protein